MKTIKIILSIALMLLGIDTTKAQKTISELAQMPDAKLEKLVTEDVNSYTIQINQFSNKLRKKGYDIPDDLTPKLKRVGILTYFLVDRNWIELSGAGKDGWGSYTRKEDYLTPAGSETFVTQFYEKALPALVQEFTKQGISLLTPDVFLDTDAKKQAYENKEIKMGGLAKFTKGFAGYLQKTYDKNPAVPVGYRLITEAGEYGGADKTTVEDIGELLKELDLDALLTVKIEVALEGKDLNLLSITEVLHGYNPMPDHDYGAYQKFILKGIYYSNAPLVLKNPITFALVDKKSGVKDINIDGFDVVTQKLTDILLNRFKNNFSPGK
ncbi:MAG: hypothetical protein KDC79_15625 [Cyclobacteriaceae bacterium]|nr:hypothetical protein [Cyclobacteriaceae bacterium]